MKWLDTLIELLLIFLIAFSPLIYGSITILPLRIVETTCLVLLVILLMRMFYTGQIRIVKVPILPLFLFLVLVIFQLTPLPTSLIAVISPATLSFSSSTRFSILPLSIDPKTTFDMLVQLLSYLAAFFVVLNYVDTEKKGKKLIATIIICGFLYSMFGIIRKFSTPALGFSTFTNRNHFASYVELIIPLTIAYSLVEYDKIKKFFAIFMASVMVLALLFSSSRAGTISLLLGFVIFMLLVKFKFPLRKGLSSFIYLSLILGLFLAAIGSNSISKKLESLRNPLKAMSGRIEVLQDAPSIIADFPVFGTGLGTFHDIFPKYKTFKSLVYRFAHNEPLQLVIETGFLGFILVAVFLALYLNTIFIVWIKRHYPYAVCISLGCVVGLISVGLHSFFEFMLHVPAVTILFFVNLAVAFRSVHMGRKQGELPVPSWSFNLKK